MTNPRTTNPPVTGPPYGRPGGPMTVERTVWCSGCARWEQIGGPEAKTVASATRYFKAHGWRKVGVLGWRCPTCTSQDTARVERARAARLPRLRV